MSDPLVSVLMPVRNEETFLSDSLRAVMTQDYDNLEILVIDGRSTDRTVEIVLELQEQDSRIRLLDNPGEWQSRALNIGLREAKGEIIARVDGHTIIAPDYIRQCVELLERHPEIESVGGRLHAVGKTPVAKAVALSYRSRFSVPSIVRHAAEDTYAFGTYMGVWRRSAVDRIGGWREDYRVQEDFEYYHRFGRAGGKTLLSLRIKSDYYCRETWRALWTQYFRYGQGKVKMLRDHPDSLHWRHIVAPIFVLIVFLGILFLPPFGLLGLMLYGWINFVVSLYHTKGNISLLWRLMLVFTTIHFAWGTGFWVEMLSAPFKISKSSTSATQQKQILFVTNYFEPDSGAAAVRLSRLARLLHQRGYQLTVLTTLPHYPQRRIHEGYRYRLVVTENRGGMRVIQTWLFTVDNSSIGYKLLSHITFMVTSFLRGLFLPAPDVLFIEAQPVLPSLAGVALALLKRRPFVLNVSDLWPDHLVSLGVVRETGLIYRLSRHLVDFIYRRASHITAMSPLWAEKIRGYIGQGEKVTVIYNGVDLNEFHPHHETEIFRQKYHLTEKKLISFIGTFATQYDFQTMIDVADLLKDRDDVLFVFIGEGSQKEFFKKHLSQRAYPNIRWIHWLERHEIPQAWNASYLTYWAMGDHDLYKGTIPAKLYEALACGVPVVAAIDGYGAEIIRESHAGMVVPCKNAPALAQAIYHLLDDETLRDCYSQAARRYAEQHYDHEKVARAYEKVLLEAAN